MARSNPDKKADGVSCRTRHQGYRSNPPLQGVVGSPAAVARLGLRQAGKITLACMVAGTGPSIHLDLESPRPYQHLMVPVKQALASLARLATIPRFGKALPVGPAGLVVAIVTLSDTFIASGVDAAIRGGG